MYRSPVSVHPLMCFGFSCLRSVRYLQNVQRCLFGKRNVILASYNSHPRLLQLSSSISIRFHEPVESKTNKLHFPFSAALASATFCGCRSGNLAPIQSYLAPYLAGSFNTSATFFNLRHPQIIFVFRLT